MKIDLLKDVLLKVVSDVIENYRSKIIETAVFKMSVQLNNDKHCDNLLTSLDIDINKAYFAELSKIMKDFLFVSEESDPKIVGRESDLQYFVILDPLDTTELAIRGLNGYTQMIIYDVKKMLPVFAVVGDIFHEINLYYAYITECGDKAYIRTRSGGEYLISASKNTKVRNSLITNFFMKPSDRFKSLVNKKKLIETLSLNPKEGRIGLDFGSIGLCHVAAGFTDAFVEFAKGFHLWDLLPGVYILEASGGRVCSDEGGNIDISLPFKNPSYIKKMLDKRLKFIAASTDELCKELSELLR